MVHLEHSVFDKRQFLMLRSANFKSFQISVFFQTCIWRRTNEKHRPTSLKRASLNIWRRTSTRSVKWSSKTTPFNNHYKKKLLEKLMWRHHNEDWSRRGVVNTHWKEFKLKVAWINGWICKKVDLGLARCLILVKANKSILCVRLCDPMTSYDWWLTV